MLRLETDNPLDFGEGRIRLPVPIVESALERMLEHALREDPGECCGLLAGRAGTIETVVCTGNQEPGTRSFLVAPAELFDFQRGLRSSGREFLGIYHSHPAREAVPSRRDAEGFHYRKVSYWIIGLEGRIPHARCFMWGRMGFEEVAYTMISRPNGNPC